VTIQNSKVKIQKHRQFQKYKSQGAGKFQIPKLVCLGFGICILEF